MTIGIPRALVYWKRPHFWEDFFKGLDFEVLLSPRTNKEITEIGVKNSDPETCFSQKVFWGHLLWLEGKSDLIFVPRLKTNKEKLEYCPKFFGLPDLAKILVNTPVLTEIFDERKNGFEKSIIRLGKKLKKDEERIKKALKKALQKEKELKEEEKNIFFEKINSAKPKIILISHPYNLFDDYVNLGLKDKLEKLEAEVVFLEEVPADLVEGETKINFHWEFAKEIMGKIDALVNLQKKDKKNNKFSGIIELSSFQCGCDAVLKEFIERECKEEKIPFLYLIVDEQTGEAGFQTRLEAFLDTLK